MKIHELERRLRKAGCRFSKHGGNHDVWVNPATGAVSLVPRHGSKEVKTKTAYGIIKTLTGK